MSGKKRKADDDSPPDHDERMSTSPSASPSLSSRPLPLPATRTIKRMRTNLSGRPLAIPRLLETLSPDELRSVLQSVCERHTEIAAEVASIAPQPSVSAALAVLQNYNAAFRASFPFGGRPSSDYAYNRVRQSLVELVDAVKDYTPNFLPPNEQQAATSLKYLDGATEIVHGLPNWDSYQHNRHKQDAYEEMARAWALVIREAAKRGAGIQLQYGGWDQKLIKHNEASGGKMEEAVNELRASLGWMGTESPSGGPSNFYAATGQNDPASIRQQLLNGTYGIGAPVSVGPW